MKYFYLISYFELSIQLNFERIQKTDLKNLYFTINQFCSGNTPFIICENLIFHSFHAEQCFAKLSSVSCSIQIFITNLYSNYYIFLSHIQIIIHSYSNVQLIIKNFIFMHK